MREFLSWAYDMGKRLGKEHGLIGGAKQLLSKNGLFAEDADGSTAVIMAFGAAILGLYIVTVVMGQVSQSLVGGNTPNSTASPLGTADKNWSGYSGIILSDRWNRTLYNFDTASTGSVSLAAVIPIAIIGVGILGLLMAAFSR